MKKTFIGGISFKRRNAEYCELKEVAPESVVLEAESERMLPIKEGDTLGKGSLMFKENDVLPAVYCGISGEVERIVSENEKVSVTIKAAEIEEADQESLDPLDKTISECLSFELCSKLLSMGIKPPKEGTKAAKMMVVDCGGSQHNFSRIFLCMNYPKEVIGGAKILMKILGARKCVFAIPTSCIDTAQTIQENLVSRRSVIKVALFKEKYPSIPQLTVYALSKIEISAYKNPENSGYPVVTPHLCYAVYCALAEGVPMTECFVSVTDEHKNMTVSAVPIGASLKEIFPTPEGFKLVRAEKIMGKPIGEDDKMEYGIEALAIVKDVTYPAITERGCIGCRRCIEVCPGRLLPYQLYNAASSGKMSTSIKNEILSCFECGCCSALCPSCLPISEVLSEARKAYLSEQIPEKSEDEKEASETEEEVAVSEETGEKTGEEAENDSANDTSEDTSEKAIEEISDESDDEIQPEAAKETQEEVVEEVQEEIIEEAQEEPNGNAPEEVIGEANEEATESEAETGETVEEIEEPSEEPVEQASVETTVVVNEEPQIEEEAPKKKEKPPKKEKKDKKRKKDKEQLIEIPLLDEIDPESDETEKVDLAAIFNESTGGDGDE